MNKEKFNKNEKLKEEKFRAFKNRYEIRIEEFMASGFTKEQSIKLTDEFSKLIEI